MNPIANPALHFGLRKTVVCLEPHPDGWAIELFEAPPELQSVGLGDTLVVDPHVEPTATLVFPTRAQALRVLEVMKPPRCVEGAPRPWRINEGWHGKHGHMGDAPPILDAFGRGVIDPSEAIDICPDDLRLIVDAVNAYSLPAVAMPEWLQFDGRDVLTINGRRYSTAMFGEAGFLSPPGTLLRVEAGPEDVVTLSTVEQAPPAAAVPARTLAEYHEDFGAVTWWHFPVSEPAWIGTPNDDDWPGFHTHWTPHPEVPAMLAAAERKGVSDAS